MAVVSLDIHVEDLASALALFDRIQVWRSATELGVYSEITAAAELPARLEGTIPAPWPLNTKPLDITLNSADPLTVDFAGTDPIILNDAIQQVNLVIPGLAEEVAPYTNLLALVSPVEGTGSSILVAGLAAAALGLPLTKVNGKAARIVLTFPTVEYLFRDFDADPSTWYKTRYYSTVTQSVSSFSDPRQGNPQIVLPPGALAKATVYLADAAGRPIVGRRIILCPMTIQQVDSSGRNYGILPGFDRIIMTTDYRGYAELDLARGQQFKVFFEGSIHSREIVVPSATTFDLLQAMATSPDPFGIVEMQPYPIRMS